MRPPRATITPCRFQTRLFATSLSNRASRSAKSASFGATVGQSKAVVAPASGRPLMNVTAPPTKVMNSRRLIATPRAWVGSIVCPQRTPLKRHGQCPLWVKSRHLQCINPCPLYPRKRTFVRTTGMSAKGKQQSFRHSFDHGTTVEGTISATIRLTLRQ
jgi:hypothetical protein